MRRWVVGVCVAVAVMGWASGAAAYFGFCYVCSPGMFCQASGGGAVFCVGTGKWCMMAGPCAGGGSRVSDSMINLTLLEDSPTLRGHGSGRLMRGAGPAAVGRKAARIAGGGMVGGSDILLSLTGYHEGGTAVIQTSMGDGFALRRENIGRGARIEVLAVAGGEPGRVLAHERLDADDALVVRVPFQGRIRVLVLQAATLPPAEAAVRAAAAEREIRDSGPGSLATDRPPFEVRILDR